MSVDLSPFSEESFDPKRWINRACESRDPMDTPDKHLADLDMKLQLIAEEIASSLDEHSQAALLRVPRSTRDVVRLKDDAVTLRSSVSTILDKLNKAQGSSAESIAVLAEIDTVKQRMEAAYETLQDAAGLTQLSATVEDVFASGDLPRAAETLANMRHCLSAVGEVAEFANVRKQLEVLEDRLEAMVHPRLTDAITYRKVDEVQNLRDILVRISRSKTVENLYTKIHLKPIRELWEDFSKRLAPGDAVNENQGSEQQMAVSDLSRSLAFSSWLPHFYDELLLYLEQEWKWCTTAFPDTYKTLVPKLLMETMTAFCTSFSSRINRATGDVVPETRTLTKGILDVLSGDISKGVRLQKKHLEALVELHNITGTFAKNIQRLFAGAEFQVLADTLKAAYSPYEPYKQRYGQMERAILSSELALLDLRGAVARGIGAQGIEISETVRRMEESIPQAIVTLEAAVERCITFTGGSEAYELVRAIDDIMLQYLSNLQDTLKSLRVVCGLDGLRGNLVGQRKELGVDKKDVLSGARLLDIVSDDEEWSIVQGALQILTVADCLTSRSSVFEASLRGTLARLSTSFSISGLESYFSELQVSYNDTPESTEVLTGKGVLDIAVLRLSDVPDKARKLFNIFEQCKDPRFHALPLASQRVSAFSDMVNELVYEVLISNVRQRLSDVARLPAWSSHDEHSGPPIPTFSPYPQAYVTGIGEYLLTLPQQLEPLAESVSSGEANADDAQFATEWMFKVAEGAAALYIEQLRNIQKISDHGAKQLAVDIEYLCNVLSALSVPIPPILTTFQACLSTTRDQLRDFVKSDGGNQLDLPTARLVCKIRLENH